MIHFNFSFFSVFFFVTGRVLRLLNIKNRNQKRIQQELEVLKLNFSSK